MLMVVDHLESVSLSFLRRQAAFARSRCVGTDLEDSAFKISIVSLFLL